MQRITITLDDDLVAELDGMIASRGYASRSEAIRDLARAGLQHALVEGNEAESCVAVLTYVYEHETRALAQRLLGALHSHHDLAVSSTHVALDHDSGLEIVVLKGPMSGVRDYANRVLAEKGVRHGRMFAVPTTDDTLTHRHASDAPLHAHIRTR
jgi:CopG family nickel-responsive transcriptional regulator